ncbi:MAG: glycoside hydrolase family 31 protein, partial [Chloroflexi bacterium]|nr:glycoside hydrolase family 31 protein [Chloroflexota bacterium]
HTEHLICRVNKQPFRLLFENLGGQIVSQDGEGMSYREDEVRWSRYLPAEEWCYGLGQRAHSLNLRGRRVALWNANPQTYERDNDPTYFSIPFYLGVKSNLAYGILWDNPARGHVDLGADNPQEMTFYAEGGELRYYLFAGQNVEKVLQHYTTLTGHMPLPPMWALGFHQSRWGYDAEVVFRSIAHEFRQRRLPCDALYFDIDYMDGYRCFTWDSERFPDVSGLMQNLAAQGFKAVAIIDPGIKVDPGYLVYEKGVQQDVFLKYPDKSLVSAPVWPGLCHFPDFTSARVRAWWGDLHASLLDAGFAGFWNDMNEPSIKNLKDFATLQDYVVHDWDGLGQSHVDGGHNVYGMLMARATREGMHRQRPDKRPFVITRAAYAGAQRYASSWTGDNLSTWDHLRLSISMTLNVGLSGLAFTGPDVGGYAGEPDAELYTRWMQLGSMLPFFRVHTRTGTASQEPWSYGEPYESIVRAALELRYQLLPYIYSTFAQCAQNGLPVVRPMFMADFENTELREIDDQFMLGDALLVAPITEPGATQRQVYLPRGVWYEFDTGKLIDGGQHVTAQAPLERMPLYARAGKVLPMWPVMQYVGEQPLEEARLRVYAGSGETTIYEDAGEGMAYQNGDYRWSYFICKFLPSGQFAIEWRRAGQYQPPYQRVRVEVAGIPSEPESVALDGQSAPIWYYEGGIVEFSVTPFNEARVIGRSYTSSAAQKTITRRPSPESQG